MAEKKQTEKKVDKPEESKKTEEAKSKKTDPDTSADNTGNAPEEKEEKEESYLKDIMAISGHGGLFRFVSQGRNGIIVEHLETGKRMQAFATMKVSALEDISVYTEDEEIQLEEVFTAIHKYEKGAESISPKSAGDDLKDYFGAILPAFDRERVYVSDIKKILGWYNLLLKHDLLNVDKPAKKAESKTENKPEAKPESESETKQADKE